MTPKAKRNLALVGLVGLAGGIFLLTSHESTASGVPDLDDGDDDEGNEPLPSIGPPPFVPSPSPSAPIPLPPIVAPPIQSAPGISVPPGIVPPGIVPPGTIPPPGLPSTPIVVIDDGPVLAPRPPVVLAPRPPIVVIDDGPILAPRPPIVLAPQPAAPPLPGNTEPVAPDTAALVTSLMAAEGVTGWKRSETAVRLWQANRGMTADGKFGPGSALKLALEVGTIPIVRFWPLSAGPRPDLALDDYRAALLQIAAHAPNFRAAQLQRSAARELGQSFGPPQGNNGKLPIAERF